MGKGCFKNANRKRLVGDYFRVQRLCIVIIENHEQVHQVSVEDYTILYFLSLWFP